MRTWRTWRTTHNIGTRILALTAVAALSLTACSSEDLSERAAEEIIEGQLEAEGENVDIDLNDGDVRIETPEGSTVIDVDDEGDGQIQFEGDDGDVQVQFDEGGGIDLPENFPSDVPLPGGLSIMSASSLDAPEGATFIISGTVDGSFGDATAAYTSALEGAGFTQQSMTESTDGTFFAFVGDGWNISGGMYPDPNGDGTVASLTVVPAT
jgi:major membrane immunogen (membrane-anchored lipoprotein)